MSLAAKMRKREQAHRATRTHRVLRNCNGAWRYFTFGFGSMYTDHKDFAGRTTKTDAESYVARDPEMYRIETID